LIAVVGLVVATGFAVLVRRRLPLRATAALVVSTLLLGFPYFAGLTPEGRRVFWFGPIIGVAALVSLFAGQTARAGNS
jgi:hypothetical protein